VPHGFKELEENGSYFPELSTDTKSRPYEFLCSNKFTHGTSCSCSNCNRTEVLKPERRPGSGSPEENLNTTHKGAQ